MEKLVYKIIKSKHLLFSIHALHANIDFLLQLSDIRTCCSQMGIVEHCIPASNSKSYLYEKERENMLCESVPFFSQNTLFEIDKKESHTFTYKKLVKLCFHTDLVPFLFYSKISHNDVT